MGEIVRERGPYDSKAEAQPVYEFTMREYKNDPSVKVRLQKRGSGQYWIIGIRGKRGRYC